MEDSEVPRRSKSMPLTRSILGGKGAAVGIALGNNATFAGSDKSAKSPSPCCYKTASVAKCYQCRHLVTDTDLFKKYMEDACNKAPVVAIGTDDRKMSKAKAMKFLEDSFNDSLLQNKSIYNLFVFLYYTGHGCEGTGNWHFEDDTITGVELLSLFQTCWTKNRYNRPSKAQLIIFADCCYSSEWKSIKPVTPCEFKWKVFAATGAQNATCWGVWSKAIFKNDSKKEDKTTRSIGGDVTKDIGQYWLSEALKLLIDDAWTPQEVLNIL